MTRSSSATTTPRRQRHPCQPDLPTTTARAPPPVSPPPPSPRRLRPRRQRAAPSPAAAFLLAASVLSALQHLDGAAAHSWLAAPLTYSRKYRTANCRGAECAFACPDLTAVPLNNSRAAPAAILRRGGPVRVSWVKNNHHGGLTRLAFVPVRAMFSRPAHAALATHYTCWDSGKQPCVGEAACGTDRGSEAMVWTITVPLHLPDGDYVLAAVWYGGLRFTRDVGLFADYFSCSHVRVEGGAPLAAQTTPLFDPRDGPSVRARACQTAIDRPGECQRDNQCTGPARFLPPRPFAAGNVPPPVTMQAVRDFMGPDAPPLPTAALPPSLPQAAPPQPQPQPQPQPLPPSLPGGTNPPPPPPTTTTMATTTTTARPTTARPTTTTATTARPPVAAPPGLNILPGPGAPTPRAPPVLPGGSGGGSSSAPAAPAPQAPQAPQTPLLPGAAPPPQQPAPPPQQPTPPPQQPVPPPAAPATPVLPGPGDPPAPPPPGPAGGAGTPILPAPGGSSSGSSGGQAVLPGNSVVLPGSRR